MRLNKTVVSQVVSLRYSKVFGGNSYWGYFLPNSCFIDEFSNTRNQGTWYSQLIVSEIYVRHTLQVLEVMREEEKESIMIMRN